MGSQVKKHLLALVLLPQYQLLGTVREHRVSDVLMQGGTSSVSVYNQNKLRHSRPRLVTTKSIEQRGGLCLAAPAPGACLCSTWGDTSCSILRLVFTR